MTGVTDIRDN